MKNKLTQPGTECGNIVISPKSLQKLSSLKLLPAWFCNQLSQIKWDDPAVLAGLKALAESQRKRQQAIQQALLDLDRRISAYHRLSDIIERHISDTWIRAGLLEEIRSDMRVPDIARRRNSHFWPQHPHGVRNLQNPLTHQQASTLIAAIAAHLKRA